MEGNKVALSYVCFYVKMLISKLQCLVLIMVSLVSRGITLRYKCDKIWQLYSTKEFGEYFCSLFSLLKLDKNIFGEPKNFSRQNFVS